MKTSTRIAVAFAAVAATIGAASAAEEQRSGGKEMRAMQLFERADTDSSGDITLEEFVAAVGSRLARADADGDGKATVAEIAAALENARVERRARRIVDRLDTDGDGALTADEVAAQGKRRFARLDSNGDGRIAPEELPRRFQRSRP